MDVVVDFDSELELDDDELFVLGKVMYAWDGISRGDGGGEFAGSFGLSIGDV